MTDKLTNKKTLVILLNIVLFTKCGDTTTENKTENFGPLNVLFIKADDMNYNSIGCCGSDVENISPNLDRLAGQGMMFTNAFVNTAVCQPVRQSMMTGRYPHNNGAPGFDPINMDVPTLQEQLNKVGYLNGILGKEKHYQPTEKYSWDYYVTERDLDSGLGIGRCPDLYYEYALEFFNRAASQNRPFFLNANANDLHRPFAGSEQTFRAMREAAPYDEQVAERLDIYVYRFPEELYDFRSDPDGLVNLIDDPAHQETKERLKNLLYREMKRTGDPFTEELEERFLVN